MSIKELNQNPERYINEGAQWKISASKDIKPIYLPKGLPLNNLKPVIKANGIIVKVGEDYLCSLQTLNDIKDSKNPHYDIVENGKLMVKDKQIAMGKTIKIIELDISRLQSIGDLQDTKGIKAGVSSVEYIYEGNKTDGISNNLITQVNYTLNEDSIRGLDTYTLYQLKLAPPEAYSLDALDIVLQPQNELLDMPKLKVFTEGVRERLKLLRKDFNMIKEMFFNGTIPLNMGEVEITAQSLSDPLQQLLGAKDLHQVIYKEVGSLQSIRDIQATQRKLQADVAAQQEALAKQNQEVQNRITSAQSTDANIQDTLTKKIEELQASLAKKKDK